MTKSRLRMGLAALGVYLGGCAGGDDPAGAGEPDAAAEGSDGSLAPVCPEPDEAVDPTAVIGGRVPHGYGDRRPGDPPVLVASIARARSLLGWEPTRSTLEEMIGSAWSERQRRGS